MSIPLGARPLTEADVPDFQPLDSHHAQAYDLDTVLTTASGRFFQRDGYSFVASGEVGRGFVIAQGTFNGQAANVQISYAAAEGDRKTVLQALFAAVAKAAYDSGVYELTATLPTADDDAQHALTQTLFTPRPLTVYRRFLGSRAEILTLPGKPS